MTLPETVATLHAEHPDWAAPDIAAHLGKRSESISNAARRAGVTLPKAKRGRKPGRSMCWCHGDRPVSAHGLCNTNRLRAHRDWVKAGKPGTWKAWALVWGQQKNPRDSGRL